MKKLYNAIKSTKFWKVCKCFLAYHYRFTYMAINSKQLNKIE